MQLSSEAGGEAKSKAEERRRGSDTQRLHAIPANSRHASLLNVQIALLQRCRRIPRSERATSQTETERFAIKNNLHSSHSRSLETNIESNRSEKGFSRIGLHMDQSLTYHTSNIAWLYL